MKKTNVLLVLIAIPFTINAQTRELDASSSRIEAMLASECKVQRNIVDRHNNNLAPECIILNEEIDFQRKKILDKQGELAKLNEVLIKKTATAYKVQKEVQGSWYPIESAYDAIQKNLVNADEDRRRLEQIKNEEVRVVNETAEKVLKEVQLNISPRMILVEQCAHPAAPELLKSTYSKYPHAANIILSRCPVINKLNSAKLQQEGVVETYLEYKNFIVKYPSYKGNKHYAMGWVSNFHNAVSSLQREIDSKTKEIQTIDVDKLAKLTAKYAQVKREKACEQQLKVHSSCK